MERFDTLEKEAESAASKISERASEVGERVSEKASELRENIRGFSGRAKDITQERLSRLQEQGIDSAERLASEVREHPLSWLLVAAGVGMCIGLLIRKES